MNQGISSRIWIVFGIGIVVIVSFVLLLAFLGGGSGEPSSPTIASSVQPTDEPVVASVDGRPIRRSFWQEAVLLDQVLSDVADQPAPAPEETLQRLINQELILYTVPPAEAPTTDQVEEAIAGFERAWGVDDAAVVDALNAVGLARERFARAIWRQLTVQRGMDTLQGQGHDVRAWLEEQRSQAEIVIFDEELVLPSPVARLLEQSSIKTETPRPSPLQSPTPAVVAEGDSPVPTVTMVIEPTPTPSPIPTAALPEVAPDFSLRQAGGGVFTLTEQLTQGPVVLVFFQRCG